MGGKPHKLKWLEKYDGDMAVSHARGQERGRAEAKAEIDALKAENERLHAEIERLKAAAL